MLPVFAAACVRTIGVISDTHNLLWPEAIEALEDSNLIIHAGDTGGHRILEEMEMIAPIAAVRGNAECANWRRQIPLTQTKSGESTVGVCSIHNISNRWLEVEISSRTWNSRSIYWKTSDQKHAKNAEITVAALQLGVSRHSVW